MSERIKVGGRKITEIETVINTGIGADKTSPYPGGPYNYDNTLEQEIVFPAPIPVARRSSREDLIKIANGYFESLGMADPGAARFGARCLRYESGSGGGFCGAVVGAPVPGGGRGGRGDVAVTDPGAPGAAGAGAAPAASAAPGGPGAPGGRGAGPGRGGAQARQQTIERRFPVAIPDLGIVVGYMFIMHHERTPPQDNFINEIFKIVDGKIREIDAVGFQVTAPGRSGYSEDFPDPGILRATPKEEPPAPAAVTQAAPPPNDATTGAPTGAPVSAEAGRGRGGRGFGGPQVIPNFPKPPYPGITEVRDLAYGSDPKQRIDILTPTAKSSKPRTVVIFVHGGGWVGGDKHAPGDDLYENVILWAAKQGMVGVNVNYRLADYKNGRNLYPTQEQDLSAAVDWIAVNIAGYGGDPNRMFLWGHSAGGSAVAGYASNPQFYGNDPIVKGIFLLSAPTDPTLDEQSGRPVPYYGKTHEDFVNHAALKTLATSKIPVLIGYSSDETGLVPMQMDETKKAMCDAGHCPRTVTTKGSHQGEMMAVGTADTSATDAFLAFIASVP